MEFVSGYTDRAGIDNRANSALTRIDMISADVNIPSAVRLVLIAEVMAGEPILTDTSPAAYAVRARAEEMKPMLAAAREEAYQEWLLTARWSTGGGQIDSHDLPGMREELRALSKVLDATAPGESFEIKRIA